jgi:Protein of unknown function (DUF4238)
MARVVHRTPTSTQAGRFRTLSGRRTPIDGNVHEQWHKYNTKQVCASSITLVLGKGIYIEVSFGYPTSMPGNEHYIPQLVQRPFASSISGDKFFVYQFRRGRAGFESITRRTAAQGDFYGKDADSVDWMFTQREGAQATLIKELREGASADDRKPQIDEYVTLMSARSRHARLVFSEMIRRGLEEVGQVLDSEAGKAALERLALKKAEQELAAKGIPADSPFFPIAMSFMRSVVRGLLDRGVVKRFYQTVKQHADPDHITKTGHVNALRRLSTEPIITRAGLAALRWLVVTVSDPLILGDAGPVARFGDSDALVPLYQGGPSVKAVFYPLSPRKLLIGAPDGSGAAIPSADELNRAMAETSSEFFIASQGTEREAGYAKRIGLRPPALGEEKARQSMLDSLAGLE